MLIQTPEWGGGEIRFEVEHGKIVKATCDGDNDKLQAALDIDEGARYFGEFALGVNPHITKPMLDTLFDEKIGGTCHLAVGASIPETGGKNKSSLHWDMVCNLQKKAEIKADGKVIYRNGKFVI